MAKLKWRGKQISDEARSAALGAIRDFAYAILEDANRLVPLEEGTLQGTGIVDVDEGEMHAVISYNTPYAIKQHEDMTLNHPNGRQAKYLETPVKERAEEFTKHVGGAIKDALR